MTPIQRKRYLAQHSAGNVITFPKVDTRQSVEAYWNVRGVRIPQYNDATAEALYQHLREVKQRKDFIQALEWPPEVSSHSRK